MTTTATATVTTFPHAGNACPCSPDTIVLIDLGDGQPHVGPAGSWAWGPGLGDAGEGRIHRWAPLFLRADQEGARI